VGREGTKFEGTVYLIDFGLSKRFRDPFTGVHIPAKVDPDGGLTGTAIYASVNAHRGCEQSRRDDMEAIGHLLLLFNRGRLQWKGLKGETKKDRNRKIMQHKVDIPIEQQCEGVRGEFATYLEYCRAMQYDEEPQYDLLRELFSSLFRSEGFLDDGVMDWMVRCSDLPTVRRKRKRKADEEESFDPPGTISTRGGTEDPHWRWIAIEGGEAAGKWTRKVRGCAAVTVRHGDAEWRGYCTPCREGVRDDSQTRLLPSMLTCRVRVAVSACLCYLGAREADIWRVVPTVGMDPEAFLEDLMRTREALLRVTSRSHWYVLPPLPEVLQVLGFDGAEAHRPLVVCVPKNSPALLAVASRTAK